jgi:hypothetical protein
MRLEGFTPLCTPLGDRDKLVLKLEYWFSVRRTVVEIKSNRSTAEPKEKRLMISPIC